MRSIVISSRGWDSLNRLLYTCFPSFFSLDYLHFLSHDHLHNWCIYTSALLQETIQGDFISFILFPCAEILSLDRFCLLSLVSAQFPCGHHFNVCRQNRKFSIQEQDKDVKLQRPLKINPSIDPMVPSATLSQLSGKGELPYECGGASCLLSVGRVVF